MSMDELRDWGEDYELQIYLKKHINPYWRDELRKVWSKQWEMLNK